ncbi:hypothetical protein GIB67_023420 [Kingdonia uniflora]|uniref:F-box domain-containing protein n=1 Tax=Kingdonia uniflora TaxID=39325 RepID=A0A7J7L1G2_9MAGN|nr:hypothetical protein GIB67_023420 [Kingdonia uniflora]
MEKLSEGTVENILIRLPVDSLVRCRYVCKHWYRLISDHRFVKLHLKISKSQNCNKLMLASSEGTCFSVDDIETITIAKNVGFSTWMENHVLYLNCPFSSEYIWQEIGIVGSCDGLLLMLVAPQDMVLWNPATRQYKRLPCKCVRMINCVKGLFPLHGFGYDKSTDDYKVVSHGKIIDDVNCEISVYTLRKDSWSVVKANFPCLRYGSKYPGILLNGILHWNVVKCLTSSTKSSFVLSFDLKDENFRELSIPKFEYSLAEWELGVMGESLCIQFYDWLNPIFIHVWVMNDYGRAESWTKLFCFRHHLDKDISHLKLLQRLKNGNFLLNVNGDTLVVYDVKRQRYITVLKYQLSPLFGMGAATYVQSLISLGDENQFKRRRPGVKNNGLEEKAVNKTELQVYRRRRPSERVSTSHH